MKISILNGMSHKSITVESYQATAKEYASKVADLAPLRSIETFIGLLPHKAKILDIGCGSGRDAKIFTDKGIAVTGIDFCPNLIDIAKINAPLAEFHLMDIEAITLPTSSFDGAWAASSLLHIPKKALPLVFENIHALLNANGCLYLSVKKGTGEILEEDSRYGGNFKKFWSFFEEDELRNCLRTAHFKILDFCLVEKQHAYQSHPYFRVFCQKEP